MDNFCNIVIDRINNDVDNKLKNIIESVAAGDNRVAISLVGYINDNSQYPDFIKYFNEHYLPEDKHITIKDLVNQDTDDIIRALREYYSKSTNSTKLVLRLKNFDDSLGFSSIVAKHLAINACVNEIMDLYYENIASGKKQNRTTLINDICVRLENKFYRDIITSLVNKVDRESEDFKKFKEYNDLLTENLNIKKIVKDLINDYNSAISIYKDAKNSYNAIIGDIQEKYNVLFEDLVKDVNKYKSIIIKYKQDTGIDAYKELAKYKAIMKDAVDRKNNIDIKKLNKELETAQQNIIDYKAYRYTYISNLLTKYGNPVEKNWRNLINIINYSDNKAWFDAVFKHSDFTDIVKELEETEVIDDEVEEDEEYEGLDSSTEDKDSIDKTARSWADKIETDFTKYIGGKTKLYLSRLYALKSYSETETDYNGDLVYDTDNEMGCRYTVGARKLINDIIRFADRSTPTNFIRSLEREARNRPELYCLSPMINKMKEDVDFMFQIYTDLNNPMITKEQVVIGNDGFEYKQSNIYSDPRSALRFDMVNIIKTTGEFLLDEEIIKLMQNPTDEDLVYIFTQIFPLENITGNEIKLFINKNREYNRRYFINLLNQLTENIRNVREERERNIADRNKKYNEFIKHRQHSEEIFSYEYKPEDLTEVFKTIDIIISNILPYTSVNLELNTPNAEGKQASNTVNSSQLTYLMEQINYGIDEELGSDNYCKGLKNLLQFVNKDGKASQYKYNPILFGIRDENGNIVNNQYGLFNYDDILGTATMRMEADGRLKEDVRKVIQFILFDGSRTLDGQKATLYAKMSKVDYFVTQLIAYHNDTTYGRDSSTYGNFFLRTPSDAPKNYTARIKKLHIDGLFLDDYNQVDAITSNGIDTIFNNGTIKFIDNQGGDDQIYRSYRHQVINATKYGNNNKVTDEEFIRILNGDFEGITTKMFTIKNQNVYYIPIIQQNKQQSIMCPIIMLKAVKTKPNATTFDSIAIDRVYYNEDTKDDLKENADVRNYYRRTSITSGSLKRELNPNHVIVKAFRQQFLSELNEFVNALNNIIDEKGNILENTNGLFDRYDYNGEIFKDGKLTGNVFKFLKLFTANGYNAGEEFTKLISLYGRNKNSLIKKNGENGKVNLNCDYIVNNNGRLVFNITPEVNSAINTVVSKWIENFLVDIQSEINSNYRDIVNQLDFTDDQITEFILNSALFNMYSDDLIEGNSKFYKDSQDFLKRAKEAQAGGKKYSNYSLDDALDSPIHDLTDINGKIMDIPDVEYTVPTYDSASGKIVEKQISARNGFRAVTIANTVRYLNATAVKVYNELMNIYQKDINNGSMTVEDAKRMASIIASGFGTNNKNITNGNFSAKVKTNDAQSYITIDEWIRRQFLKGTLSNYKHLLPALVDPNHQWTVEEVENLNNFIQVEKNFYFDITYDNKTHRYYPRQIKNAEFVLIPSLIKGTDLEKLYDIMKRNDIGQINTAETSKAAKRTILTFWDNDGKVNENFEQDLIDDKLESEKTYPIETYYYNHLYEQQKVPQHMKDAKNKAGIQIMKKIIDNGDTEGVKDKVDDLFKVYSIKIKKTFDQLMFNMGWKLNSEGKVVNIDGSKLNLDFTEFYKKAMHEAQRVGLDSNVIEYFEPDETGHPVMPNWNNNVSTKLENIAQAIFNSAITRQTLPGWHAAQVTGVGHGVQVADETGKFRTLEYHPADKDGNPQAYCEIMIPRWSNLIPGDYTIEQLKAAGLDMHIGYRIPTEGKQSVCIFRVVGFLHDIYGSTVMVPDEWVAQTGSDFDVDSIYGISYKIRVGKGGVIEKIPYDNDETETGIKRRYVAYARKLIEETPDWSHAKDVKQDVYNQYLENKEKNKAKAASRLEEFIEESADIRKQFKDSTRKLLFNKYKENKTVNFVDRNKLEIEFIRNNAGLFVGENQELLNEYIELIEDINNFIVNGLRPAKRQNYEMMQRVQDEIDDETFKLYSNTAKSFGLISYNEFAKLTLDEQQSEDALTNKMLDDMIAILESPDSREENYSRSNYDDLTESKEKIDKLRGADDVVKSAYNPFTQINYMDDVMSGARLKAISVNRDTFNSINNRAHTKLSTSHQIPVIYTLNGNNYSINNILAFNTNERNEYFDGKEWHDRKWALNNKNKIVKVKIYHNTLGWSENRRNVVGRLLTCYSSQTTAHILDAVKVGAIYNENEYTFGIFKTLLDVGIDYDTAVAFIEQPAVTRILNFYNAKNSLYSKTSGDEISHALGSIAEELGFKTATGDKINEFTARKEIFNSFIGNKDIQNAIVKYFGVDANIFAPSKDGKTKKTINFADIALDYELLAARRSKKNKFTDIEKAAIDFMLINKFSNLYVTTKNIETIANCVKADKFGAKQTIFETRKMRNDIEKYAELDEDGKTKSAISATLEVDVNGTITNLVDTIYPFVNNPSTTRKSVYPYIADFYKYSTLMSIDINSQIFKLESDLFESITTKVGELLGINFNNDEYKEFKQYFVLYIYNQIPLLVYPVSVDENNKFKFDDKTIEQLYEGIDNKFMENIRINGYDETIQDHNVLIKDIFNPTQEEIDTFAKLTPVQKIVWIKTHFNVKKTIFDKFRLNPKNNYQERLLGYSKQSITFNDQTDNIEELYSLFRDAFYMDNKLVRLTLMDIIKYAYIAEGFRFKKGGVSKIIPNNVLLDSIDDFGTEIVSQSEKIINERMNTMANGNVNEFAELYARSHKDMFRAIYLTNRKDKAASIINGCKNKDGMIAIANNDDNLALITKLGLANGNKKYMRLITKVNNANVDVLYRVEKRDTYFYLIPLNPLEQNEVATYSVISRNQNYLTVTEYLNRINMGIYNISEEEGMFINDETFKETNQDASFLVPDISKIFTQVGLSKNEIQNSLERNTLTGVARAQVERFVNNITDAINNSGDMAKTYVDMNDSSYLRGLFNNGKTKIVQEFEIDGKTYNVVITKTKLPKKIASYVDDKTARPAIGAKLYETYEKANLHPISKKTYLNIIENKSKSQLYTVSISESLDKVDSTINDMLDYDFGLGLGIEGFGDNDIDSMISDMESLSDFSFNATTETIDDFQPVEGVESLTEVDKISKALITDITKINRRNPGDSAADEFMQKMISLGVDENSNDSIKENDENIFLYASRYYQAKYTRLKNMINNYHTEDGRTFSIDSEELYHYLIDNPSEFNDLVTLVLDAITFGNRFNDIVHIDFSEQNDKIKNAADKLKKMIDIRNDAKVKKAMNMLFNQYLAEKYSTNPLIQKHILELTDVFGDVDFFDKNIADVGHLNHKQIQNVLKAITEILNATNMIEAPAAIDEFNKDYEAIMNESGAYDESKFITPNGKLINAYTDEFIETKQAYLDKLHEYTDAGLKNTLEYHKTKLEYDEWKADNTEQYMVADYYKERNANIRAAIENAGNLYVRYRQLNEEIYGYLRKYAYLTDDERKALKDARYKIKMLLSTSTEEGELKDAITIIKIKALTNYIANKKLIENKYFVKNPTVDFEENLKYNLSVIERYDTENPSKTLDEKLLNEKYKDAFDWIHTNAHYVLDDDANAKLEDAYKKLNVDLLERKGNVMNLLISKARKRGVNPITEFGEIDGTKFNDEEIEAYRNAQVSLYTQRYGNNFSPKIFQEVPTNHYVFTSQYYSWLHNNVEPLPDSVPNFSTSQRVNLINEANIIISKAINKSGEIDTALMFNDDIVSNEERIRLIEIFDYLDAFKPERRLTKIEAKRFWLIFEKRYNTNAYDREYAKFSTTIADNTEKAAQWRKIFNSALEDFDGNIEIVPNQHLFGYVEISDPNAKIGLNGQQYPVIDKDKTAARELIEKNILYEPNEYYYSARNRAIANGTFKEWFNLNHIYNPNTHKWEPLRFWLTTKVDSNGDLQGQYHYEAIGESSERYAKNEYVNNKYIKDSVNYNEKTGYYNNLTSLSDKERKMRQLFKDTITDLSTSYKMKKFTNQGYLPRRRKTRITTKWAIEQALGTVGLNFNQEVNQSFTPDEELDYANDYSADFPMLDFLKTKGYKEHLPYPIKGTMSDDEYKETCKEIANKNKEIDAHNLELEQHIIDHDWKGVFNDFIAKAYDYKAKVKVKNLMYLMIEDLKTRNAKRVNIFNNLVKDKGISTSDEINYKETPQTNALSVFRNYARRILFNEFKQPDKKVALANVLQNVASSKYMIANVLGGINNVTTGLSNIFPEAIAKEFFNNKTLAKANAQYVSSIFSIISSMYSETSSNETAAIIKFWDVVDYDAFTERRTDESIAEWSNRIRNWLYSPQTMGEHYMQNTALLAALDSHRIYRDSTGKLVVGTYQNYINDAEFAALFKIVKNDPELEAKLREFNKLQKDDNAKFKYDTLKENYITKFIRYVYGNDSENSAKAKELTRSFVSARREIVDEAKTKFNTFPKLANQYRHTDNGIIVLNPENDEIAEVLPQLTAQFKEKVKYINKKIHGVYDKIGAAQLEKYWYGSLVMQYHKHLYPGILKRWRTKGYYNELTGTFEKGSYISLLQHITAGFKDFKKRVKEDGSNEALASIKVTMESLVRCIMDLKYNYQSMPIWEQRNVLRAWGDIAAIISAFGVGILMYVLWDDDELKDDEYLASLMYVVDRAFAENYLYTPFGLVTEWKSLYASPVASANGPSDLFNIGNHFVNILVDPDYNPVYTTGMYKGENKAWVKFKRNIPLYRVINRLRNMTKNNKFYKLAENNINMTTAKNIADKLVPNK